MSTAITLVLALLFAASTAPAAEEENFGVRGVGRLVGEVGPPRRVEIVFIDGVRLEAKEVWIDRDDLQWRRTHSSRQESQALARVAGVRWIAPVAAANPSGPMLMLRNGERFPGRPDRGEGSLRWIHPWLGAIEIDLESMQALDLAGRGASTAEASAADRSDGDRVRLQNGDLLEGLVLELTTDCVVEGPDGNERVVPLELVDRIDLLATAAPPGRIRVRAFDGTVLDATSVSLAEGSESAMLSIRRAGTRGDGAVASETTLLLRELESIALAPDRSVGLAAIEPRSGAMPDSQRPWIPPPAIDRDRLPDLGIADVEISGPARIAWRVPKGAVLSTVASLPDSMRRFGDFTMTLRDGDRVLLQHHFDQDSPRIPIAVVIATGELVLELEQGRHGAVQDRLHLASPLLITPRP